MTATVNIVRICEDCVFPILTDQPIGNDKELPGCEDWEDCSHTLTFRCPRYCSALNCLSDPKKRNNAHICHILTNSIKTDTYTVRIAKCNPHNAHADSHDRHGGYHKNGNRYQFMPISLKNRWLGFSMAGFPYVYVSSEIAKKTPSRPKTAHFHYVRPFSNIQKGREIKCENGRKMTVLSGVDSQYPLTGRVVNGTHKTQTPRNYNNEILSNLNPNLIINQQVLRIFRCSTTSYITTLRVSDIFHPPFQPSGLLVGSGPPLPRPGRPCRCLGRVPVPPVSRYHRPGGVPGGGEVRSCSPESRLYLTGSSTEFPFSRRPHGRPA